MKLIVLLIAVVGLVAAVPAEHHPLSDEFIAEVNKQATTWTAGRNFHRDISINYLKGLMGSLSSKKHTLPVLQTEDVDLKDLPTEFDARTQWPTCTSIGEIRDQSQCGSCWAISAAEVMSDRYCIHIGSMFHFSTPDINSCCQNCGDGCMGGYPTAAMEYWKRDGVVSGGQYNSSEGCYPYTLPKCEHHVDGPLPSCDTLPHYNTPKCEKKCQAGYPKKYEEDKKYASSVYSVRSEAKIMKEIMTNGPVQASFTVYGDFPTYKTGVYKHTSGSELGGHAVRMLGWGEENGVKYWLMANSWNSGWGDKGFFKILRGEDECGIEGQIDTGIPKKE